MSLDTLGKRLKYAREKKGIKQNFAARKLGISAPTLANYETDFRRPDPQMLQKMIDLYEEDANYILGSDGSTSLQVGEQNKQESESEPIYVYADPLGWIEKLAAEYKEKTGQELPEWKKKAILELIEANRAEEDKK